MHTTFTEVMNMGSVGMADQLARPGCYYIRGALYVYGCQGLPRPD